MAKFLLIKAYGWGFWADMEHVMGQLLVAELTGRIPVVYWGMNSLYSDRFGANAFELYYEPVSGSSLREVLRPEFRFYPPIWSYKNALVEDLDKTAKNYRNLGEMMNSDADVVVSDTHCFPRPLLEYVKKDHWAYGMTPVQIYRIIAQKYLRLKSDIQKEIDDFYEKFIKDKGPVLGVHVRGTDKVIEVANLGALNRKYHTEIGRYIRDFGIKKIFLLTDSKQILEEYESKYKDMILTTNCNRSDGSAEKAVQVENYVNRRRKGIEVLVDTYLAAKCDYFVGNGYSNVSFAVNRLKNWQSCHIVLFYNTLEQERMLSKKRASIELLRRKTREMEHRLNYPELYGGALYKWQERDIY
jgi:hypothetical protein